MIEKLPIYVVAAFILTTLLTLGIFNYAIKRGSYSSRTTQVLSFFIPFWLFFQATLAVVGFYQTTDTVPPRLFLFGVLPALLAIAALFIFSKAFISRLPLKTLTIIHIVRIPVEIILLWLFQHRQIPQAMTFEGANFDILSGLTAPFIYWLAFRADKTNRPLLIIWNLFALGLLINIVGHAALAVPSPIQQIAFDQPNLAVLHFPFIWLPTFVVPVVLLCHLASLFQLFKSKI